MHFSAINIHEHKGAKERLAGVGVRSVPAVVVGNRGVEAIQLHVVAALIGETYQSPPKLSPAALLARLDLVLRAAQRYVRQVPANRMGFRFPDRDRSFLELAHHVFVIGKAFLVGYETGRLPWSMIVKRPPDSIQTGEDLASFGDEVLARFHEWWQSDGGNDSFEREIETYYGTHPLHDVFERTTWHTAQHTRQLMLFLDRMGLEPDGPLTEEDLAGLPLPKGVWE